MEGKDKGEVGGSAAVAAVAAIAVVVIVVAVTAAMSTAVAAAVAATVAAVAVIVAVAAAVAAAEQGMKDTIPLQARKGRASYLGERSIGHQDPNATSVLFMVQMLAAAAKE